MPAVGDLPEVTFIGHSHLCNPPSATARSTTWWHKFAFRRGYQYLISVGSVGQPRDYDSRACFVVCDTTARTVEYIRVEYDIEGRPAHLRGRAGTTSAPPLSGGLNR